MIFQLFSQLVTDDEYGHERNVNMLGYLSPFFSPEQLTKIETEKIAIGWDYYGMSVFRVRDENGFCTVEFYRSDDWMMKGKPTRIKFNFEERSGKTYIKAPEVSVDERGKMVLKF